MSCATVERPTLRRLRLQIGVLRLSSENRRITLSRSDNMKFRIGLWASAGFLVACSWALFAFATFPSTNERMRDVWILVSLTCPIAIVGRHYPISLYAALAANAITY